MTAQTVSSAVATREAGPVNLMWSRKNHFAAVLPDHIDVKSFLGTAAGALYASAQLMTAAQADPDSLIIAMMRCAALGHQPGTDEYYLTPRKKAGRPTVLGIEGYRGIIERMYRSGAVRKVVVREVCAKDKFRYVEGIDEKPVHSFGGEGATGADFFGTGGKRDRGEMVGVYAYAELLTGAVSRVVILDRDDVLAARDAGGYKPDDTYTPWNRMDAGKDHPEFRGRSMWWKTAARRLEPWVPTSAEYRREQLRAASAASDLSAARVAAANGSDQPQASVPPPDMEIHDAEIVDDTAAGKPGPTAAPGAGAAATTAANARPRSARGGSSPDRPTGSMLGRLGKLLIRLGIRSPEDTAAFLAWQAGRPGATGLDALTRDEVAAITATADKAIADAEGDTEEAASRLWTAWKQEQDDAQQAAGPDGDSTDG